MGISNSLSLSLSSSIAMAVAGGSAVELPSFAFQSDTDALVATFSSAPTDRRKKTIDEFYRTVKTYPVGAPVWDEMIAFSKFMADANGRLANWKDLTRPCTVNGTVTSTDVQSSGTGTIRSDYLCNEMPANDFEAGIYLTGTTTATLSADFGGRDATTGITMTGRSSAGATGMAARCAGASVVSLGEPNDWDGVGLHAMCRKNSAEFEVYKGPVLKDTITQAAVALPAQRIYFMGQNQNGATGASTNTHSGAYLSRALTDEQRNVLHAAFVRLHQKMATGDLDDYLPGYQPQSVTEYDFIVYGATFFGTVAAYELKRQGKTVCIVGDAADRRLGGITTGGLGHMDSYALANNRGLARWCLRQCQDIEGKATSVIDIQPQTMERVLRAMCDPSRTNGLDIPIFWSDGIASASEDATSVTIVTNDGRTFTCKRALEATDENVLVRALGITTLAGREAAGSGIDGNNGVRAANNVFKDNTGAAMVVDPFVAPGDSGSGLIAGVHGMFSDLTVGAASPGNQAFNERIPVTNDPSIRIPFPTTPPTGYDAANYELLGRQLDADPLIEMGDLFNFYGPLATTVHGNIWDLNNGSNGMSTDCLGDFSTNYITGTYAQKAAIAVQIRNYILGLWYYLQHDPDTRVPAALRTDALKYGRVNDHHCDPDWSKGEMPNWPNRIYVREPARMVSDFKLVGDDLNNTDGSIPRSIKTISTITYPVDSHSYKRYAYNNGGTWETVNEGGFFVAQGGTDLTSPLPYEVCVPPRAESTRVLVAFGGSINHVAFGGTRMELTAGQTAQSLACALMIAEEEDIDVQDVDYTDLRTRILATPTLTNETAPYLPQTD